MKYYLIRDSIPNVADEDSAIEHAFSDSDI